MNIITFKYTKSDGKVSNRTISPVITPNKMYEGIDISELDAEGQVYYCQEVGKLHDEYMAKVNQLNLEMDVVNRYRRFDPSKMTEIIEESV